MLFNILRAINEIETFLLDVQDYAHYQNDLKTKRIEERFRGRAFQYSSIIHARNRTIHGYDRVSDEVIQGIIKNHLSILKTEIEVLLKS